MKTNVVQYNPEWATIYNCIHLELNAILMDYQPVIEHIGSTSVNGLSAKPVIDVLVGVDGTDALNKLSEQMIRHGYVYFEKNNLKTPYRRFFVKMKRKPESLDVLKVYGEKDEVPEKIKEYRIAHIHIVDKNSIHWIRHIAFREYLKYNHYICKQYETIKKELNRLYWVDTSAYGRAKNTFIRQIEDKAIAWYNCLL